MLRRPLHGEFLALPGAVEKIKIGQLLVRKARPATAHEAKRDLIAHKERERWGGGLSAQADAFIPQKARDGEERAGANAEEKVGLLRSK